MSLRYPTGLKGDWFPNTFEVRTITSRDVYGEPESYTSVDTTGSIRFNAIELIESGARAKRDGARIKLVDKAGLDISVGTVVRHNGVDYSAVGVLSKPDHQGNTHFWILDTVVKNVV